MRRFSIFINDDAATLFLRRKKTHAGNAGGFSATLRQHGELLRRWPSINVLTELEAIAVVERDLQAVPTA